MVQTRVTANEWSEMGHRSSLIGLLIVLCLLLLTFAGCSKAKELTPALVLEKAYAATTEEVSSFHFTISIAATAEGMGEIGILEGEVDYLAPDRLRWRGTEGSGVWLLRLEKR